MHPGFGHSGILGLLRCNFDVTILNRDDYFEGSLVEPPLLSAQQISHQARF